MIRFYNILRIYYSSKQHVIIMFNVIVVTLLRRYVFFQDQQKVRYFAIYSGVLTILRQSKESFITTLPIGGQFYRTVHGRFSRGRKQLITSINREHIHLHPPPYQSWKYCYYALRIYKQFILLVKSFSEFWLSCA